MMFIATLLLIQACSFALWLTSLRIKNVSIVDIFWGLGFALVTFFCSIGLSRSIFGADLPTPSWPQWLLTGMVVAWGVRLGGYLFLRNHGKPEDYRYAAMREHWGGKFTLRSLYTVFLLQGSLIWFISLPVQCALVGQTVDTLRCGLGFSIWAVGLFFESIGDWQMYSFKKNPDNKGKVMNRGLWRFTRHPNYFGDFMVWWGLYIFSAQPESWWWTILSPLLMSILLLRVSGVSLLESSLKNRLEGYEQYIRNTNSFFPWFPKSRGERG
ncbi:MAG: DUF1295 domain-containing protein [Pirellulales bacterium]